MKKSALLVWSLAFLLAAVAFASSHAHGVAVYRENQATVEIPLAFTLSDQALSPSGRVNRGLVSRELRDFVDAHRELFGLSTVTAESLLLRTLHRTERGWTARFIQRYHRVLIEDAELVVRLDPQGKLVSLNSSLVSGIHLSVTPDLSEKQALQRAIKELNYSTADWKDNRLVITHSAPHRLTWRLNLRDLKTGERALQILVGAQLPSVGLILETRPLEHSSAKEKLNIYDASINILPPNPLYLGVPVLLAGEPTKRVKMLRWTGVDLVGKEVQAAVSNLSRTLDFYQTHFQRDSYDGQGTEVNAVVNVSRHAHFDLLGFKENASWNSVWKLFNFGAGGKRLGNFVEALDVVAHEFTHSVVTATCDLAYRGQSGALNEHLADVFGVLVEHEAKGGPEGAVDEKAFLMGNTVLRGEWAQTYEGLRDMVHPHRGVAWQPEHTEEIADEFRMGCIPSSKNDACGVHILSGIPNLAAAKIIQTLGPVKSRKLYYEVMTSRLRANSDFTDYRNQLVAECKETLGKTDCQVVEDALQSVGL